MCIRDSAWEVRDYLKEHPRAAVINLGCGLDDTGRACDNGMCRIYNIDLPDVIALRNRLLPAGGRERNLPLDLRDPKWTDTIDARPSDGAVLFAAGVFYYFPTDQVRRMIVAMAERFPCGRLVFDAAGKAAVKLMLKTWVKMCIRDRSFPMRSLPRLWRIRWSLMAVRTPFLPHPRCCSPGCLWRWWPV